jgi:hypothetical protein
VCSKGEGAHSPKVPNELNCILPWLILGQIKKKTSRYVQSRQKGE